MVICKRSILMFTCNVYYFINQIVKGYAVNLNRVFLQKPIPGLIFRYCFAKTNFTGIIFHLPQI